MSENFLQDQEMYFDTFDFLTFQWADACGITLLNFKILVLSAIGISIFKTVLLSHS